MISDERFFAWIDGELNPAEAAAVGALVAADPELQRRAEAHRALRSTLNGAFDPIAEAELPPRLRQAVRSREAEIVDLSARRAQGRLISRPAQWAAMAATLAIGVVVGSMIDVGAAGPVARDNGQLVAANDLEAALYTQLASAPAEDGVRIALTFRDPAGDLCRSFTDKQIAGLACHKGGNWRIRGLFQAGEGQQTEFRMASGADPRLAELIEATMAGEPLDSGAERQAISQLE